MFASRMESGPRGQEKSKGANKVTHGSASSIMRDKWVSVCWNIRHKGSLTKTYEC